MKKTTLKNNTEIVNDTPYALNLFFTGKCNLNCHYCFVKKEGIENSTLDEKSLKKSVDILFSYPGKKKTISFNGGEPTLEFPLVKKIYEYARKEAEKRGIILDVAVMTNGTLLNQEMIDYFIKNKTIVKISIDGDKITHDQNRPFKINPRLSSFDTIIENINRINSGNLRLAASMVFTPRNISRFLENIKFLNSKKFYYIEFYPDLYARWEKNDLEKVKKVFKKFEIYYIKLFKTNKKVFKNSLLDTFVNDVEIEKMEKCGKIHINALGGFYVCDKVFSLGLDKRKKYIVGNIENEIDDKKRSSLLKKLRKDFFAESKLNCKKCQYYKYCFCPLGHYIYFKENKKNVSADFWQSFCYVSRAYNETFLRIKSALKYNARFIKLYNY